MDEARLVELLSLHNLILGEDAVKPATKLSEKQAERLIGFAKSEGAFAIDGELFEQFLASIAQRKMPVPERKESYCDIASMEMPSRLKMAADFDITGKSRCTGTVEDFHAYFLDRFRALESILKGKAAQAPTITLKAWKAMKESSEARVIGMLADKRETKNGNILFRIEDESASINCLATRPKPRDNAERTRRNQEVFAAVENTMPDEVIAVEGSPYSSGGGDAIMIANRIDRPDLPIRGYKTAETDACIAFTSDVHIGSRHFMENEFRDFIDFLNCRCSGKKREYAERIKYLVIAGDLVDGIGIYPEQEENLLTKDLQIQYQIFEDYILQIPEHIEVVISPGNHDGVRRAEPQPALSRKWVPRLHEKKNIHLVGNPAWIEIEGLLVLIYHGSSIDSLVSKLPSLGNGYEMPELVGQAMMERRHLMPYYGDKPIVPEKNDFLVVRKAPDIFHFGHVHKNGYKAYRGTWIINSGAWESTTDYQVKQGHVPTPGQLPIFELRTGRVVELDFERKGEREEKAQERDWGSGK